MSASRNLPRTFGNYELIRLIARGGMAEVYEGYRHGLHGARIRVAVKCILPHLTEDETFVRMFIDEARHSVLLHHPNLIQVQEFNEVDGVYFIAMEYIDGWTVAGLIDRLSSTRQTLPFQLVAEIMLQALTGLAAAHDALDADGRPIDLVHRDLKPANLFLSRQGVVKIGDFGVARAKSALFNTLSAGQVKGTLGYMSPEQLRAEPLTRATDLFSMGLILYELLTGARLFQQDSLLSAVQHVNDIRAQDVARSLPDSCAAFRELLEIALQRSPEQRYNSADDFAYALRQLQPQLPPAPSLKLYLQSLYGGSSVTDASPLESSVLEMVMEDDEGRPRGGTVQLDAAGSSGRKAGGTQAIPAPPPARKAPAAPPAPRAERAPAPEAARPAPPPARSTPEIPPTLVESVFSAPARPAPPPPPPPKAEVRQDPPAAQARAEKTPQSKPLPPPATPEKELKPEPGRPPEPRRQPEPAPEPRAETKAAKASKPAPAAPVPPPSSRSKGPLLIGAGLLVLVAGGIGAFMLSGSSQKAASPASDEGRPLTARAPVEKPADPPASAAAPAPASPAPEAPAPQLANAGTADGSTASNPAVSNPTGSQPADNPPAGSAAGSTSAVAQAPRPTPAPKPTPVPKTTPAPARQETAARPRAETGRPAATPAPVRASTLKTEAASAPAETGTKARAATEKVSVRISAIPFDDTYIRIDGGGRNKVPWNGELSPGKHTITAICEGIAEPYELKTELVVDATSGEFKASWRCQDRTWYKAGGN